MGPASHIQQQSSLGDVQVGCAGGMCRWVMSRQGGEGMTKKEGEEQERKGGKGEEDETGEKVRKGERGEG